MNNGWSKGTMLVEERERQEEQPSVNEYACKNMQVADPESPCVAL
jgi:hypothetical protein